MRVPLRLRSLNINLGSFLWPRYANQKGINTLENILHKLNTQSYHKTNDYTIVRLLTFQWDRHLSDNLFEFIITCKSERIYTRVTSISYQVQLTYDNI